MVAGVHKPDQNFRTRIHITCDDSHTAAALEFQGVQAAVPDGGAEPAVLISDVQVLQFRNHAFDDAADFIRFYGQGVKLAAAQFFNGGGHLNASGGRLNCSMDEAIVVVKQAIEAYKDLLGG